MATLFACKQDLDVYTTVQGRYASVEEEKDNRSVARKSSCYLMNCHRDRTKTYFFSRKPVTLSCWHLGV